MGCLIYRVFGICNCWGGIDSHGVLFSIFYVLLQYSETDNQLIQYANPKYFAYEERLFHLGSLAKPVY